MALRDDITDRARAPCYIMYTDGLSCYYVDTRQSILLGAQ